MNKTTENKDMNKSVLDTTDDSKTQNFKNKKPRFFVSKAGMVGVRGVVHNKPLVLYKDQWDILQRLFESGHLNNFIEKNIDDIKVKNLKKENQ